MKSSFVLLFASVLAASVFSADSPLDTTRATVQKWVETRQLIGRLRSDWRVEQDFLKQTIAAFERELAALSEQLDSVEDTQTQTDVELEKANNERKELRRASEEIKIGVARFEERLRKLSRAFPAPLAERIDPPFRQLPRDTRDTRKSLSARMQNVIGILNEADKFNSGFAVSAELRKSPSGAEVRTQVLYVGLGQAYFTDQAGTFAGVGVPTADGWQWTPQPELGPTILKAIAIYESAEPAAFVSLPVQIK